MSEDTTTWLKKNPSINPLGRSIKTSLRINCPNADMDSSIVSNPDEKNPELFIPKMLRRRKSQSMSRVHQFKVPELVNSQGVKKKENMPASNERPKSQSTSRLHQFRVPELMNSQGVKKKENMPASNERPKSQSTSRLHQFRVPELVKSQGVKKKENLPASNGKPEENIYLPKKSFLPVLKSRSQLQKNEPSVSNFPRQTFLVPGSGRRTTARIEILQKLVESSQTKLEDSSSQTNVPSGDSSVLRSILKKKRDLRRNSQFSSRKPTSKKVLFNTSDNQEKPNDENVSPLAVELEKQTGDFDALDEFTVFFTFPNSQSKAPESVKEAKRSSWTVTEQDHNKNVVNNDIENIISSWNDFRSNISKFMSKGHTLEKSLDRVFQCTSSLEEIYESFKKDFDEMKTQLLVWVEKFEEKLDKLKEAHEEVSSKPVTRLAGKKLMEKEDRIGLSDKSKVIKKNTKKKLTMFKNM